MAYYSKGKFRTKGRKGTYPRTWTLKGKAKGAPIPGNGKGRGLARKGTGPFCTRCRRPGHSADHCYATTYGKGLRYYDEDSDHYDDPAASTYNHWSQDEHWREDIDYYDQHYEGYDEAEHDYYDEGWADWEQPGTDQYWDENPLVDRKSVV